MKKSEFYIDVDKMHRTNMVGRTRITVYLNGRKINKVIAAKSGKNGFVEYHDDPIRISSDGEYIISNVARGNVKISMNRLTR